MFKDINWNKVLIIMIISFLFLTAGWLLYINYGIKGPLEDTVASIEGVTVNDISVNGEQIDLEITLNGIDNFQDTYREIQALAAPHLKGKSLNISFANKGNEEIIVAWNQSYFYIAEAVEQKKYTLIPETMDSIKINNNLDKIGYGIDEDYLYFDLHKDGASLYIVIPRSADGTVNEIG